MSNNRNNMKRNASSSGGNSNNNLQLTTTQQLVYGFYTKAFPHLLPYAKADLSIPRLFKNPTSLLDYLRHLTRLAIPGEQQNRFSEDMRFVHLLLDIHLRTLAETTGK